MNRRARRNQIKSFNRARHFDADGNKLPEETKLAPRMTWAMAPHYSMEMADKRTVTAMRNNIYIPFSKNKIKKVEEPAVIDGRAVQAVDENVTASQSEE